MLLASACAVLGLCIGSFLNVVIWRVPAGLSIVRPGSACPDCSSPISAKDNVSLLSWLALRGRCRFCQAGISARYPAVEALVAVLFVLLAFRFGLGYTLGIMLSFASGLVALAFIDLDHLLLPRRIVYCTLLIASVAVLFAAGATGDWERLLRAVACGATAFVLFLVINLVNPRWLGFGDVRLAPLIGLCLGWVSVGCAILGFVLANFLGAAVGIALIISGQAGRKTLIPFGVFLAAGALLSALSSEQILGWYQNWML